MSYPSTENVNFNSNSGSSTDSSESNDSHSSVSNGRRSNSPSLIQNNLQNSNDRSSTFSNVGQNDGNDHLNGRTCFKVKIQDKMYFFNVGKA